MVRTYSFVGTGKVSILLVYITTNKLGVVKLSGTVPMAVVDTACNNYKFCTCEFDKV